MISLDPQSKRKWDEFKKRNGRTIYIIVITFLLLMSLSFQVYFWYLGTQAEITEVTETTKKTVYLDTTNLYDYSYIYTTMPVYYPAIETFYLNDTIPSHPGISSWKQIIDENITQNLINDTDYNLDGTTHYSLTEITVINFSSPIVDDMFFMQFATGNSTDKLIICEKDIAVPRTEYSGGGDGQEVPFTCELNDHTLIPVNDTLYVRFYQYYFGTLSVLAIDINYRLLLNCYDLSDLDLT